MHTNDHFLLPRCTGMNCGATDANHSPECRAEHAAAVAGGRFVKGDAPIAPRAKYDPATQPGSPEFDGAEAYQAHLEAMYPDEAAPRADADTAGAKPQTDAEALYEAWTNAINTGTGMVRVEHVPREDFAATPASSVADAAGVSDAAITACAVMIKGICMTRPQELWVKEIEKRIRFMIASGENHE